MKDVLRTYAGDNPYIFVNYSHKDRASVFPLLDALTKAGYRIWFDDGISVGERWPEAIETKLRNCSVFLTFLSRTSVESEFVRNELHYALKLAKNIITVSLEPAKLSHGLDMMLARMLIYQIPDSNGIEAFLRFVRNLPIFNMCLGDSRPSGNSAGALYHNGKKLVVTPYEGEQQYIFISYSHNELEKIFPFIRAMVNSGFRVWYDEGIHIGDMWREVIVGKMNSCKVFFPFLSVAYFESRDCKRELIFSDKSGKIIVPAYMEEFRLDDVFDYMLCEYQALKLYRYSNIDDVVNRLKLEPNLMDCWE